MAVENTYSNPPISFAFLPFVLDKCQCISRVIQMVCKVVQLLTSLLFLHIIACNFCRQFESYNLCNYKHMHHELLNLGLCDELWIAQYCRLNELC